MAFLTNEKLVIVGAGGMIGSNMVQSVLMLGLTPNICLYDIYEPGVHGVYDEMCHCAFPGANLSYTVDPAEAFTGAKYIISSGGEAKFYLADNHVLVNNETESRRGRKLYPNDIIVVGEEEFVIS